MKIEFSFRYGVIGIYRDRSWDLWRIYPLPFVRVTFGDRYALREQKVNK